VSTRSKLESIIQDQIPNLGRDNLIVEPVGKDTAPSIMLSCIWIARKNPSATVMFLPADHYVSPTKRFVETSIDALLLAERTDNIVIMGITPTYPATGYGYIQSDFSPDKKRSSYSVLSFREKPDAKTAERYLKKGNYFWNSGIFVARIKVMMEQIREHAPQIYRIAQPLLDIPDERFRRELTRVFAKMPKISLDYAVMERSRNVTVIPARFAWNDLGSWSSLEELPHLRRGKNVSSGPVFSVSSEGNIVSAGRRLVTLVDVRDLVIALANDAVLVCRKGSSQKVKEVVRSLKQGRHSSHI